MMLSTDWWDTLLPPIALSIRVAVTASLVVFVLAAAAARFMAVRRFPGRTLVETFLLLPLVLPPTVVGFVMLMLIGRRSWLGSLYESLFDRSIVFTWGAAAAAAVVVAFPLAYRTMRAGFESIDRELQDAARSLGASEWQVFRHVDVPLAARALTAGFILGFARGLGEFGATLMVAGSIPGRTLTIPTAIYVAVDNGQNPLAWALSAAIAALSFLMLALSSFLGRRE